MARKKFVCGNWKMHKTTAEARELVRALAPLVASALGEVQVAVAPTFTALAATGEALAGTGLELAAQNVHCEVQGAFTGEISAPMLADLGVKHGIVGHSERRQYFGETDEGVRKKVVALFKAGVLPIVCVGETLQERESNRTLEVVSRQVKGALDGLASADVARLTLAYEPVWAIGTGKTATTAQAQEVHAAIRKLVRELAGDAADAVRIQYGGSVKPDNASGAPVPAGRRRCARGRGRAQGRRLLPDRERRPPLIALVTILHVVVCVVLILVILLQAGKGGGMGSAFGGGAQTVFGGRGAQTVLGKVTSACAAIFMVTSLTLAYHASHRSSVVRDDGSASQPSAPAPAAPASPAPAAPAPSAPAEQGAAPAAPAAPAEAAAPATGDAPATPAPPAE